jgi:2-keto-4-pentenoate hydratase
MSTGLAASEETLRLLAQRLRLAYDGVAVAPIRAELETAGVRGAYRVQAINTEHWTRLGRRIVGRKIGLTSKAVQLQLGVDEPDFGVLFHDCIVPDGGELACGRLLQPKVEAEIALVLARDVTSAHASAIDMLTATAYVLPALEIVDSRIAGWDIRILDTVADNASSGMFVLGSTPVSLLHLDLRTCGMVLEIDGRLASQGVGAACLGHPLDAAAWLARTLIEMGDPLRSGDIVLTGALGPMVPLQPGMRVDASIGGVGRVGFRYAAAPAD